MGLEQPHCSLLSLPIVAVYCRLLSLHNSYLHHHCRLHIGLWCACLEQCCGTLFCTHVAHECSMSLAASKALLSACLHAAALAGEYRPQRCRRSLCAWFGCCCCLVFALFWGSMYVCGYLSGVGSRAQGLATAVNMHSTCHSLGSCTRGADVTCWWPAGHRWCARQPHAAIPRNSVAQTGHASHLTTAAGARLPYACRGMVCC